MAGHSHAKNVMHKKALLNSRKAKTFTKIARVISVALQDGPDVATNFKLKHALRQAQLANMPKDIIQKILEKKAKENTEEIIYAGYFKGVAILIEAFSDNRNKTACEMRTIFNKNDGIFSDTASVLFLFNHVAYIECLVPNNEYDHFFESAVNENANEVEENKAYFEAQNFHKAQMGLEQKWPIQDAQLCYIPKNFAELTNSEEIANFEYLLKLLDENENTQAIWHNLKE